jgi:hypothetical protein
MKSFLVSILVLVDLAREFILLSEEGANEKKLQSEEMIEKTFKKRA